jgi:Zinc-binding dehydrogenase
MPLERVRLGALALAIAGVLFVLYPAIRPYSDEASLQGAAAFASGAWIVAHVLAMLGFVLVALGLLAGKLRPVLDRTYPLAETAEGLRRVEAGHVPGKLVIVVA